MALVLIVLGLANISTRLRLHEVEDGVLWSARPEGVTAVEVAPDSAAARAGIVPGDVLVAVNGAPVELPADVIAYQHASDVGTRLAYSIVRLGERQALTVSLAPLATPRTMYFVLATVGLFTLLVGASVRLRRPTDQATLHFFWLCVAFFGAFTFSFNGPFDRLDWVFYWGDAIAMTALPPLLLHFTLVFPERSLWRVAPQPGRLAPARVCSRPSCWAPSASWPSPADPAPTARSSPACWTCSIAPSRSTCSCAPSRPWSCWCGHSGRSRR